MRALRHLIVIIVGFACSILLTGESWPMARAATGALPAATLDLSNFNFEDSLYSFRQAWDFYPGQWLQPNGEQAPPAPTQTPFYSIIPEALNMGPLRHGTFHLQVRLPDHPASYALFVPELRSASKIWVNGQLLAEKGSIAAERDAEHPEIKPMILLIPGTPKQLDLWVQISAYSNYQFMGSSTPVALGHPLQIFERQLAAKTRDAFVVGAIFIMAFYHFSLYFLRREKIDPLLFGLFCLWIGIRTAVRSDGNLVYQFVSQPDFSWHYRFEYWGITIPTALCAAFMYALYPKDVSRLASRLCIAVSLLYTLLIGFLPLRIYGGMLVIFEVFIVLCAGAMTVGIVRAIRNGRNGSMLLVVGFLTFMIAVIHDIVKNHGYITTPTLSHIGLFLFILVQAIIISKRFSLAFTRLKTAQDEIHILNEALEQKVKDRTQTIRIILDNVKAGFLLIGSDLKIQEGFTKSCLSPPFGKYR